MIRVQNCTSGEKLEITEVNCAFTFFCSSIDIIVNLFIKNHTPNYVDQAELSFPLVEGCFVCGYAVDIDGVMVPAQIVTKEKARKTYAEEAQTFHKSKTSIVEQEGNVYKIKLNCLPSNSLRQVRLNIMHHFSELKKDNVYEYTFPFLMNDMCKLQVSSTVLNLFLNQTHRKMIDKLKDISLSNSVAKLSIDADLLHQIPFLSNALGNNFSANFEDHNVRLNRFRYDNSFLFLLVNSHPRHEFSLDFVPSNAVVRRITETDFASMYFF